MLHNTTFKKIVLLIGLISLITLANVPKVIANDDSTDITIPGGENKSLWELTTDPYTRYIGSFFHLIWIMSIAGVAWMKSDDVGMPLLWIIISSAALAGLPIPGAGTMFFVLVTSSAVTIAVIRIVIKRRKR